MQKVKASIVITTRNRRDDVLRAVASCLAQEGGPEVLVFDDASDDGTADALNRYFPMVSVEKGDSRRGYIYGRNEGFRRSKADIVFSIDDDAWFTSVNTVESVLEAFEANPRLGAVAIPFLEPVELQSPAARACTPTSLPSDTPVRSYIGCAHAIRRELALELGGYREYLVHQGEERDLCLRLWGAGYEVRVVDVAPIVHNISPKRDMGRMDYYGVRNTILFALANVPWPDLPLLLIKNGYQLLRYRYSMRSTLPKLKAMAEAFLFILKHPKERQPVRVATWRHWKRMIGHGAISHEGPLPQAVSLETTERRAGDVSG